MTDHTVQSAAAKSRSRGMANDREGPRTTSRGAFPIAVLASSQDDIEDVRTQISDLQDDVDAATQAAADAASAAESNSDNN